MTTGRSDMDGQTAAPVATAATAGVTSVLGIVWRLSHNITVVASGTGDFADGKANEDEGEDKEGDTQHNVTVVLGNVSNTITNTGGEAGTSEEDSININIHISRYD
jgi:hypothetical protein